MSGKNGKPNARKKKEKGGARKFVTSAEEMAARDFVEEQRQSARKMRRNEGSEDDEEEEGESEEEDDGLFDRSEATTTEAVAGITLDEKPKKRSGVAGIIKVQNPNLMPKQNKVMKAKDMDGAVEQQLTRREREAIEKERAAAAYMKRHLAGETAEAKKDLARLEEVRKRREEAEKRRKEEEEAAAEREKNQKKIVVDDDDEVLDARAIKALKPNVLKDKLKERGLSIQGQKKDLVQRLIDYENEKAL